MKNIFFILLIIQLLSCQQQEETLLDNFNGSLEYDSINKENLRLSRNLEHKDSTINTYSLYINEIRNNLGEIRNQQNLINIEKNNAENLSFDNKDIIEEIELIGNLMIENKRLIKTLRDGLKNSDLQLNEFDKMVISLTEEVQTKNMEIYYLQEELENMDASLGELFDAYNEKVLELTEVKDILNTAWYTFGTKGELTQNSVITKEGGFIGIGSRNILKDDFNKAYFTELKISDLNEIPLGVRSAKLVTTHPSASYELITNELVDKLVIKNKDAFWNNSKYLVIVVK